MLDPKKRLAARDRGFFSRPPPQLFARRASGASFAKTQKKTSSSPSAVNDRSLGRLRRRLRAQASIAVTGRWPPERISSNIARDKLARLHVVSCRRAASCPSSLHRDRRHDVSDCLRWGAERRVYTMLTQSSEAIVDVLSMYMRVESEKLRGRVR